MKMANDSPLYTMLCPAVGFRLYFFGWNVNGNTNLVFPNGKFLEKMGALSICIETLVVPVRTQMKRPFHREFFRKEVFHFSYFYQNYQNVAKNHLFHHTCSLIK